MIFSTVICLTVVLFIERITKGYIKWIVRY